MSDKREQTTQCAAEVYRAVPVAERINGERHKRGQCAAKAGKSGLCPQHERMQHSGYLLIRYREDVDV